MGGCVGADRKLLCGRLLTVGAKPAPQAIFVGLHLCVLYRCRRFSLDPGVESGTADQWIFRKHIHLVFRYGNGQPTDRAFQLQLGVEMVQCEPDRCEPARRTRYQHTSRLFPVSGY